MDDLKAQLLVLKAQLAHEQKASNEATEVSLSAQVTVGADLKDVYPSLSVAANAWIGSLLGHGVANGYADVLPMTA